MPFTPACPSCGGTSCDQVAEEEYACNDCENNFVHDGSYPDKSDDMLPEGLELDMQEFEDRISCLGDD
jgi:ribosomal protein L37AE/L43A